MDNITLKIFITHIKKAIERAKELDLNNTHPLNFNTQVYKLIEDLYSFNDCNLLV